MEKKRILLKQVIVSSIVIVVGAIGGYILGLFLQLPLIYNIIGSGLTVIAGTIGAVTGMHATQRNTKGEKSDD